jgi:hypothetical protein
MVHKIKSAMKEIEWGFDLTDVVSDDAFLKLLRKYGFREISSKTPDEPAYEGADFTWRKIAGGRWKKYNVTFKNPRGIRITVEHMGGIRDDKGALGFIGIKAPKTADMELKSFLREFRGNTPVSGTDRDERVGITTYVKEENPHENPYITVR